MQNQQALMDKETIIKAERKWLAIDWAEIWDFRDLLYLFVQKEFIARYRQTILGPLWYIIQPLLLTVVFSIVFGRIGRVSTDGMPPMLFYLGGLVCWGYFLQCFDAVAGALVGNAYILRKVYFPRLIIPLSVIFSKLLVFVTQLAVFLAFLVYYNWFTPLSTNIHPQYHLILIIPVMLLMTALLAMGMGLWFAALTVKYRDFSHLTGFVMQLWFYGTPIVYPASRIPDRLFWMYQINPMSFVVDNFRAAFLGTGEFNFSNFGIAAAITLFVFVSGLAVFNRIERNFVDVV